MDHVLLPFAKRSHKASNRSHFNDIMKDAIVAAPVDPQVGPPVEAPLEAPADDEAVARDLDIQIYGGEEYDGEAVNHQTIIYRMMAAVSADATKQVVRNLSARRKNKVTDLVHVFKVLYEATGTENLMETERETQTLHRNLANNLVRIARDLVQVTTCRMTRNGARADEHKEIDSTLIADAQYLRNVVFGEE